MRAPGRGEPSAIEQDGPRRESLPAPRRFVSRETVAEAFAGTPCIDYEQLRADIDAIVDQDPTPRFWRDE